MMAIIYNTNVSYAHDTTRACRLLYLDLCRSVERLSASDVHNPHRWRLFAGTCTDDCMLCNHLWDESTLFTSSGAKRERSERMRR